MIAIPLFACCAIARSRGTGTFTLALTGSFDAATLCAIKPSGPSFRLPDGLVYYACIDRQRSSLDRPVVAIQAGWTFGIMTSMAANRTVECRGEPHWYRS